MPVEPPSDDSDDAAGETPATYRAPLTPAALREVALQHLAHTDTTRARLIRILDRRIERWSKYDPSRASMVPGLRKSAREVAAALATEGILDDAAFAEQRAQRLVRSGRSHRAVVAHLAARGVASDVLSAAIPRNSELSAALATAHRRKIGPFRTDAIDADGLRREMAVLARAGFSRDTSLAALRMPPEQAEAMVLQLKRD